MKTKNRILDIVLVCTLVLSACAPSISVVGTQTPEPTITVVTTPTPRREVNVALKKPVRVSASWVVDPPERAVDGNLGNWWGAGGPAPQWVEVDLEGIYSISRIRVVNQGPTGNATYQVFGRGPDNKGQLLHTFDGYKSENQTLEFSPDKVWKDISTIRIEIPNGTGWVGLREIQVFSREEPKPLPASAESSVPSFLAQLHSAKLAPITPDNAIFIEQLAMLGRGTINELAWSPDGKVLAAASPLGVWLYDATDPDSPPRLLEGHTRDVLGVVFSPDGKLVLSGSQDGTVKQWEIVTGNLRRTISLWDDFSYEVGEQKRDAEVWSIAFSPDRNLLASGSLDGTLRLWNLKTGKQHTVLEGHTRQISNLAFSSDGTSLASYSVDGAIFVWDIETGRQVASLSSPGQVQSLAFSPDGKILAYGGTGMAVQLWDTVSGEEQVELPDHTGVISLAFSPDGQTLASSSLTGTVRLWEAKSGNSSVFRERAGWIMNMVYSPDGATLATSSWDGRLRFWETGTGYLSVDLATHTSPVTSISFSPDNRLLASGGEDGGVRLWEVKTNSLRATLWGHVTRVFGVAFSPDGKLLASAGFDGTVRVWDTASGRQLAVLEGHESYVRCVAFSPDSKTIASGSTDKTIRLWDVATGEEHSVLTGHSGEVESVAFSPDGKWILSASADKTLRIWDVATGKESGVLKGHLSPVLSASFSPDGTVIASGGGDHWVRASKLNVVLGVATGTNRFPPIGHPGWVLNVAFSPDGRIIASANLSTTAYWVAPGEVHLYSSETGYPYALLRGHTKRVTSVAFSPDGKLLASGSADGSVRLWGVRGAGSLSGPSQPPQATPTAPTSTPKPVDWDPFVGEWTATDPSDGSNITMTITRNEDGSYRITQIDDGSSGCGVDGAGRPKFGIEVELMAEPYGDTLSANATSAKCLSAPPSRLEVEIRINFIYQAATDTLLDDVIRTDWKRRS